MIVKGQTDPLAEMRGSRQIDASDLVQYSTTIFLDATTHLHKRSFPSVGRMSRVIFERRKSRFSRLERLRMTNNNNNNNNDDDYNDE